jgi:hypothetical protein
MPTFVTFDDGITYVPLSEIESFGLDRDEDNQDGTLIKLRNGGKIRTMWKVSDVAEKLGPCANLHY